MRVRRLGAYDDCQRFGSAAGARGENVIKLAVWSLAQFIVDDETLKEIFVHVSGLLDRDLKENEEVIFDIAEDERGKKAINVQKK